MKEVFLKILKEAVAAPSGDNSQPWRFEMRGDTLLVFNLPEADHTLYNFRQRGSFISHGALLENIKIVAGKYGFRTDIEIFPETRSLELVGKVNLIKSGQESNALYDFLEKRSTNRKPYKALALTTPEKQEIYGAANELAPNSLLVVDDKEKINDLSSVLCLNERLFLENFHIHQGLFSFIRWTKEEEESAKTGLYVKTLELAPPQEFVFKRLSNWKTARFLNKFGISKLIARDTKKLYSSSAAFGLITINSEEDRDFVLAGMVLQRIWLTITKLGLSLQPTAALLYLYQRVVYGDIDKFSSEQIEWIKTANKKINEIFGLGSRVPAMLFRIGKSDPPTERSLKFSPLLEETI